MKKVMVYGSLKKGFGNHGLLRDATYVGEVAIDGFDMFSLGPFPAIQEGEGHVEGELYEVDTRTLASLDRLEGHPVMYERTDIIATHLGTEEKVECYVYVYQGMCSKDEQIGERWTHEHLQRQAHTLRGKGKAGVY